MHVFFFHTLAILIYFLAQYSRRTDAHIIKVRTGRKRKQMKRRKEKERVKRANRDSYHNVSADGGQMEKN